MTDMEKPHSAGGVDELWLNLRRVYDTDRATLVWSSLSSAYDRLLFAHHHLLLLRKLVLPAVKQGLEASGFRPPLIDEDNIEALFSQTMYQVKMHVTDCIQHMHAVGDTIAFAVHFFVEFPEGEQLKKKDITLLRVRKLLCNHSELPSAKNLLKLLDELATDKNCTYVSDLNNHAKHRSIVKPAISLASDEEMPDDELKNLLVFPLVEMSHPTSELQDRGATPCHGQRPILSLIETELARIWGLYGEMRQEIEKQVRLAASKAAHVAAGEA